MVKLTQCTCWALTDILHGEEASWKIFYFSPKTIWTLHEIRQSVCWMCNCCAARPSEAHFCQRIYKHTDQWVIRSQYSFTLKNTFSFQYDLEFVTFLRGVLSIGSGEEQLSWHRWEQPLANHKNFWNFGNKIIKNEGKGWVLTDAMTGGPSSMDPTEHCVMTCLDFCSYVILHWSWKDFIQSCFSLVAKRSLLLRFQGCPNYDCDCKVSSQSPEGNALWMPVFIASGQLIWLWLSTM